MKTNHAILFSFAFLATTALANPGTPDELIARLRSIPLKEEVASTHGSEFFDMHGNASRAKIPIGRAMSSKAI